MAGGGAPGELRPGLSFWGSPLQECEYPPTPCSWASGSRMRSVRQVESEPAGGKAGQCRASEHGWDRAKDRGGTGQGKGAQDRVGEPRAGGTQDGGGQDGPSGHRHKHGTVPSCPQFGVPPHPHADWEEERAIQGPEPRGTERLRANHPPQAPTARPASPGSCHMATPTPGTFDAFWREGQADR